MSLPDTPSVQPFDAYYFQHSCGLPYGRSAEWLNLFGGMADQIVGGINPGSVLDAGCAMGFLVEALRDRGIEAFGCDISEYAISRVREDVQPFCWVASIVEPLPRHFDLIICIEVVEHLRPADALLAIANLCGHTEDVLFSSTPSDFREATHLNVQPVEYWAEMFARHGFFRDVDFDATFIAPWSARFRRSRDPIWRTARDYERKYWLLQQENHELRRQTIEIRSRIQKLELEVARLGSVLEGITNGLGWRLLQTLAPIRRFGIPPGSLRERAVSRVLGVGRKPSQPG